MEQLVSRLQSMMWTALCLALEQWKLLLMFKLLLWQLLVSVQIVSFGLISLDLQAQAVLLRVLDFLQMWQINDFIS